MVIALITERQRRGSTRLIALRVSIILCRAMNGNQPVFIVENSKTNMSAVKQLAEERKIETLKEADFAYQEEKQLIKVAENLYVPSDFEKDHSYYADAQGTKRYYGITTILGVIAKPMLHKWYADMAVNYIEDTVAGIAKGYELGDQNWMKEFGTRWAEILREAPLAGFKKRDKAGEDGTSVHEALEKLIKSAIELNNGKLEALMVTEDTAPQVKEFVQWAIVNEVKFLASEQRLYSTKLWVAGTADFIAIVKDKLMVGDLKTNNSGIYPEHIWQATAYAFMAREMGLYQDFKGVVIVNVPKRGGIKVQENYDLKGNFQIFKGALAIFKGKEAQKVKKLKK